MRGRARPLFHGHGLHDGGLLLQQLRMALRLPSSPSPSPPASRISLQDRIAQGRQLEHDVAATERELDALRRQTRAEVEAREAVRLASRQQQRPIVENCAAVSGRKPKTLVGVAAQIT